MVDKKATGHKIANLMYDNGYTILGLAETMDIHRRTVDDWRAGRKYPSIDNLARLSDLFGVTIDEIIVREGGTRL